MKIKPLFYIGLSAILFSACAEAATTEETTTSNETQEEEVVTEDQEVEENAMNDEIVEEEIVSKYAYDQDWEMIKEAILNQDIPGLGAWAGSDAFDAEYFLETAKEEWVIEALKKTAYEDLQTDDMGDEVYLVFYAEITEIDEEGNEYGSSISLYMSQGDPNLRVEYYIAAG